MISLGDILKQKVEAMHAKSDLASTHAKQALEHLNEICPDTFDEGEFGPWTFHQLSRQGSRWALSFDNSKGQDCVLFTFEGDCVDEDGVVNDEWFEQASDAISDWENSQLGIDDD